LTTIWLSGDELLNNLVIHDDKHASLQHFPNLPVIIYDLQIPYNYLYRFPSFLHTDIGQYSSHSSREVFTNEFDISEQVQFHQHVIQSSRNLGHLPHSLEHHDRGIRSRCLIRDATYLHMEHIHLLYYSSPHARSRAGKRAGTEVPLLRRKMRTDIKVENIHRKTHSRTRIRYICSRRSACLTYNV
jgi:hypothetical protein